MHVRAYFLKFNFEASHPASPVLDYKQTKKCPSLSPVSGSAASKVRRGCRIRVVHAQLQQQRALVGVLCRSMWWKQLYVYTKGGVIRFQHSVQRRGSMHGLELIVYCFVRRGACKKLENVAAHYLQRPAMGKETPAHIV